MLRYEGSSDSNIDEMPFYSEGVSTDESDRGHIQENNPKKPVERQVGEYLVFSYEEELFQWVTTDVS